MIKKWMIAGLLGCMALPATAQDNSNNENKSPKGKAIIAIYSDVHSGFGAANNDRGFDLDRAYLGYQYDLPHNLQIKAVVDFGQSKQVDDYQRIGYIKNALVTWKHKQWTLNAGLISTTQFKLQEDYWGRRYIMKSFQDEYKFGSSADLAVSVAYRFSPLVSADAIVANGEGYKKVQVKDGLQYGAGITLTPACGLTLRAYGSYNEANSDGQKGITNLAAFAGYKNKAFSLAAEYNYQTNASFINNHDQSGVSVYTSIKAGKRVEILGRWDYLTSKDKWNKAEDGMNGLVGAEFQLGKYIKLAPNFRIKVPKAEASPAKGYIYLNASFAI